MLELPESQVISDQMREMLTGKAVESVVVAYSPHRFAFYSDLKPLYESLLAGRAVQSAFRCGGIPVLDFGEFILYFSDGASPRYLAPGEVIPKKHQLLVRFTDASHLVCCVQMYGCMHLAGTTDNMHAYYRSSADKPDVLSDAFDYAYFRSLLPQSGPKLTLKGFLATEQRIPGLGNGVLQDILWNARLDPRCDARQLAEEDLLLLYHTVRDTLASMCKAGGRCTERDFYGNPGGYVPHLYKDTLGRPCPRCGTPIEKAAYMGGAVYFCPTCQRR